MARDINKTGYSKETLLKLDIFAECFREWLPVFLHDKYTNAIFVYDFFAGSGTDSENEFGSPLILLDEAKGQECKYCNAVKKRVSFVFNESETLKSNQLSSNVNNHKQQCSNSHCKKECIYSTQIYNKEFKDIFYDDENQSILQNSSYAKFILLDQYGFKQIDKDVFSKLTSAPKTDFIFFISSSFIKRFKDQNAVTKYFGTDITFDNSKPKECHRAIAQFYKQLVPAQKEYYIHQFTIKKNPNYWGLIFGTNHSLGMEKILKVCWDSDRLSGESNCNINNDYEPDTLFYSEENTNKKDKIRVIIKNKILSGEIKDNKTGLKYALSEGCLPELFIEVVKELEKQHKITRNGELNWSSTNIHRVKVYNINVL